MTEQKSKKEQSVKTKVEERRQENDDAKENIEQKPPTLVYVGPSLEMVPQFSVFHNGLPTHLLEKTKAYPILNKLIIKLSEMPTIEGNLSRVGSKENLLFNTAKKQLGSDK